MDINSSQKWDADYQNGTDRWDLGGPHPTFKRLAASGEFAPGVMLVLGAGRGYDAREFARNGFQVAALDFSAAAVQEMQRLAKPDAPLNILQHDMFALPKEMNSHFDYILEYVTFCAIHPSRREEFAGLVARLLKPGGLYISLAFPLRESEGGPPFSVSAEQLLNLFTERNFQLIRREWPEDSIKPRRGFEELLIFQKIR
ncbi:MAG: methyltransferase domain-containing protein [Anaerolineales bacterium]